MFNGICIRFLGTAFLAWLPPRRDAKVNSRPATEAGAKFQGSEERMMMNVPDCDSLSCSGLEQNKGLEDRDTKLGTICCAEWRGTHSGLHRGKSFPYDHLGQIFIIGVFNCTFYNELFRGMG